MRTARGPAASANDGSIGRAMVDERARHECILCDCASVSVDELWAHMRTAHFGEGRPAYRAYRARHGGVGAGGSGVEAAADGTFGAARLLVLSRARMIRGSAAAVSHSANGRGGGFGRRDDAGGDGDGRRPRRGDGRGVEEGGIPSAGAASGGVFGFPTACGLAAAASGGGSSGEEADEHSRLECFWCHCTFASMGDRWLHVRHVHAVEGGRASRTYRARFARARYGGVGAGDSGVEAAAAPAPGAVQLLFASSMARMMCVSAVAAAPSADGRGDGLRGGAAAAGRDRVLRPFCRTTYALRGPWRGLPSFLLLLL